MGNSNSHSVHNSLARFSPSSFYSKENRKKKLGRFVSPENKVLPEPVAGQRLRITDNGNILHSGGTISGRKMGSETPRSPDINSQFIELLQRRSDAVQKSTNFPRQNGYGHRKSHSDPDIVRLMMAASSDREDESRSSGTDRAENSKSVIAISPSKAKIKSRKKNRAPEPPHSNTLPRALDRMPLYPDKREDGRVMFQQTQSGDNLPPPPPPPPPDYNKEGEDNGVMKMPSKNYEKNKRNMAKWKLSKDFSEIHKEIEERRRCKSLERTEDPWNSKKREESQNSFKRSSLRHLEARNEAVETSNVKTDVKVRPKQLIGGPVKDVTSQYFKDRNSCAKTSIQMDNERQSAANKDNYPNSAVRQYYFADITALKCNQDGSRNGPSTKVAVHRENSSPFEEAGDSVFTKIIGSRKVSDNSFEYTKGDSRCEFKVNQIKVEAPKSNEKVKVVSSCSSRNEDDCVRKENGKMFEEHTQILYRPMNHCKSKELIRQPVRQARNERNSSGSASGDDETEIDLRLRPTLPRRNVEIPRFSPSEVWKSISLDYAKTHHRSDLSSEEGDVFEEKIHRISRPVAPRRATSDRCGDSGISPDAGSPMLNDALEAAHFDNGPNMSRSHRFTRGNDPVCFKDDSKQMWTPQQDLLDESDAGSNDGMKRDNHPAKSESHVIATQARLALPNMFPNRSLPRNTENTNSSQNNDSGTPAKTKHKGRRKRGSKANESQHFNSLRNLKKVFGIRSKSTVNEENERLDTNWSLSRSLPNFISNFSDDKEKSDPCNYENGETVANSDSETRHMLHDRTRRTVENYASEMRPLSSVRPQFSHYSEGHLIYLPEYNGVKIQKSRGKETVDSNFIQEREIQNKYKQAEEKKKFSYQSTAKKEERRKLEEHLAREIEEKERKRQREIEWMNRVEEEFRKQRDKEKVNIRHQLRILHLEEEQNSKNKMAEITAMDKRQKSNGNPVDISSQSPYNSMNCTESLSAGKTITNGTPQSSLEFHQSNDNWKHPTGMSKWLRRHKRGSTDRARSFSPPRPEPEGGSRSSSDECKHFDEKSGCDKCPVSVHPQPVKYEKIKEPRYGQTELGKDYLKREQQVRHRSINQPIQEERPPSPEFYSLPAYVTHPTAHDEMFANPKQKCIWNTADKHNDAGHSIEEYGVHTRLRRTGSGRTFESHSYYVMESHKEVDVDDGDFRMKTLDMPRNHAVVSSTNFQKELRDNVRRKARETGKHPHKNPPSLDESDSCSEDDHRQTTEVQQKYRKTKRQPNMDRKENGFDGGDESSPDEVLNSPGLSFTRNHPHRNGGRIKGQPVNGLHKPQDATRSAIHLSMVQPFQSNKRSQQVPQHQKLHPSHHCHTANDSHNRPAVYVQAI